MEKVEHVISKLSDEELTEIAGGVDKCGWFCSYTLDCPGTRWFNCC